MESQCCDLGGYQPPCLHHSSCSPQKCRIILPSSYKDKGVDLDGIKMTMNDLDEIVIKRLGEIIKEEYGTYKYKKIDRLFNENKKFRNKGK